MASRASPEISDISARRSGSPSLYPVYRSPRQSLGRSSSAPPKIALIMQQMDSAIAALQTTIDEAKKGVNDDERPPVAKKRSRAELKIKKEKEREETKDSHGHHDGSHRGIFGMFHRKGVC